MSASIQDIKEKFNLFITEDIYFYTVLIVVISILSFGLGRLSVLEQSAVPPQRIVLKEQSAAVSEAQINQPVSTLDKSTASYVASKNGTKYHLTTCPGAKRISQKNKVYFTTEEEARASGYTRAKNCTF